MKNSNAIVTQVKNMFCFKHSGKMLGMVSLSTSMRENPICQARAKNKDTVCASCYVEGTFNYMGKGHEKYKKNTQFLTTRLLDWNEIPLLNCQLLRFEAFGDLMPKELGGVTQARNYLRIARVNELVKCSLFTKNLSILEEAIELEGKPKNLTIIYSIPEVNPAGTDEELAQMHRVITGTWKFVDKIFTVHDKNSPVTTNCEAKSCFKCRKCYTHRGTKVLVERLRTSKKKKEA